MRRSGPWKAAIPFVLLFLAVYGAAYLEQWMGRGQEPGSPTSYSSGTLGYKILYLWLKDLEVPVERWEKTLKDLPSQTAVLVQLDPRFGPEPGELGALEGWVRGGGTLFMAVRQPNPYLMHFGLGLSEADGIDAQKEPAFQPGPYIGGKREIRGERHPDLSSNDAGLVVHVRDRWGALIGVVEKGKGRVIVLTDPSLFSNLKLRQGDHGQLALEFLLSHMGEGPFLFDEYHHGYGRATSVIGHVLDSGMEGLLFQGALILLVLWTAAGRRFGPPRPLPKEAGPSPMEYVRAMAGLFQRAGANRLALETVSRWIEEEAGRLLVGKDRGLRERLKQAKALYQAEDVTERDLLVQTRDLYAALEKAKSHGPGG